MQTADVGLDPKARDASMIGGVAPHVARRRDRSDRGQGSPQARAERSLSMLFVWLHVAWFGVWIVLNEAGVFDFDEFPFGFLTMIASLEAIFLSTFVLVSQNHQALQSDRRAKVDLQVNMVAEQERSPNSSRSSRSSPAIWGSTKRMTLNSRACSKQPTSSTSPTLSRRRKVKPTLRRNERPSSEH